MKRICVIALAIILVAAVFMSLSASAATMYRRGDADKDDLVTILDATVIQRKLASIDVKSYNAKSADVNGNKTVEIVDSTLIQRYLGRIGGNPYNINALFDPYELPFIPKN